MGALDSEVSISDRIWWDRALKFPCHRPWAYEHAGAFHPISCVFLKPEKLKSQRPQAFPKLPSRWRTLLRFSTDSSKPTQARQASPQGYQDRLLRPGWNLHVLSLMIQPFPRRPVSEFYLMMLF